MRTPPPEVGGLESAAEPGESTGPSTAESTAGPSAGPAGDRLRPRFPHVDALRAVAALAVVLTHTAFVSGAIFTSSFKGLMAHLNVGVTLFFLISGFLLYRPYVAARASGLPPPSWTGYARRRFLRIAPAYWLALTALAVFPGLAGVFSGNWWVYYGLLQPYPIYQSGAECLQTVQGCGIAPTWSLSVEVAFYVLLPVYAAVLARLAGRRAGSPARARLGTDLWVLAALAGASLGLRLWLLGRPSLGWMYSTVVANFAWFSLGMAVAVVSVAIERRRGAGHPGARRPVLPGVDALAWVAAVGLFCLLSLRLLPATAASAALTRSQHVVEHLGLGLVALLLLLPAVTLRPGTGVPGRVLGNRVLGWLGLVSYGIFLWHLPVMFYLADRGANTWLPGNPFVSLTAATMAVTVALAAVSYYLVERPLMRWSRRSRTPA
jgi:peptidoglycan/LPS O-acetylase OafA/YrhL